MTLVLVDLTVNAPDGRTTPAKGTIFASPAVRRRDGSHVVLTTAFAQVLVDGTTTLVLTPGVWRIREDIPSGGGTSRMVTVPDTTDTVNYGDLAVSS